MSNALPIETTRGDQGFISRGRLTHVDHVCLLVALSISMAAVPTIAGWCLQVCLTAALLMAAWIDTRTRLIPNRLTYPLVLLGIAGNLVASLSGCDQFAGVVGAGDSLQGAGLCFGFMLLLFVSNATGGGDVKLATAIGAFLGPQAGLMAIAWCHLLAGGFAVVWLISQWNLLRGLRSSFQYILASLTARRLLPVEYKLGAVGQKRLPMAAFFALGVWLTQLGFRLW